VINLNIKVKIIGNSKGIIIPAHILKHLDISEKDDLELVLKNKQILIYKKEKFDPKSFDELFANYNSNYKWEYFFKDEKGKEKW
jgi:antitoxin component of MazEF toxin-antitoxin module